VNIEIRYFDDCPNWIPLHEAIIELIAQIGLDAEVTLTIVDTPETAQRLTFKGSPTVVIDGTDPWDDPDALIGLSCRVYRTEHGFAGAPTATQLRDALTATR
jgi:hypothetical protein